MPELPEVETVRRGLQPVMEGARFTKVVAHRGDLRWPLAKDFAARLEGKTVKGLGRRAKYLLADLSSDEVLVMHLGMSGSFRVARGRGKATPGRYYHDRAKNAAHDHVVFHMSSGARISFNDPRRFGMMKLVPRSELDHEPLLRALGPEPLGNAFDAEMLARACKGRKTSLKAAVSDQRVVAGLGNIYVCEALHRARLSPKRRATTAAPMASSVTSSTISASMIAPGNPARRQAAMARSGGWCRPADRRSSARSVSASLDEGLTDGVMGQAMRGARTWLSAREAP
jgi:formamidopyrimidine-DNA glycosylase